MPPEKKKFVMEILPAIAVFVALGGFLIYAFVKISSLESETQNLSSELASTTATLAKNNDDLSKSLADLRAQTAGLSTTLSYTQQNVSTVQTQVGNVVQNVGSISSSVNTLQKLAATDPELLKKYSKVFFLNDNYAPAHLINIPTDYVYSGTRTEQFITEAWPFLKVLMDKAKSDGIQLFVKSAYRSFGEQQALKSTYTVIYGAGTANSFSADQGYSEHQLGTTIDFITNGLNGQLDGFDKTPAYQWLLNNAYSFGFELSYTKGNGYYVFEPWHWRFVGAKLSGYLHSANKNFYDMDQRDIDPYLADIFD